jgi:hypothetical protein
MAKLIYLDSSDFSDLSSSPETLRAEDAVILARLREVRDNGTALFLLSPPLLSEAVHATAANKSDSLRRASLMRELCGGNALRFPTDICKIELTRAFLNERSAPLTVLDILSGEDEFFGSPYGTSTLSEAKSNAQKAINLRLDSLPRDHRRKLKSQLNLSKASSRALYRQLFKDSGWKTTEQEFPLSLIDQELFQDWFVGEKRDADVDRHLRQIISNPYVIFRHVADTENHRETLYSLVRRGGEGLSKPLEALGENLIKLHNLTTQFGQKIDLRELVGQDAPARPDEWLRLFSVKHS